MTDTIETLKEEVERLRKALELYRNPPPFENIDACMAEIVEMIARKARRVFSCTGAPALFQDLFTEAVEDASKRIAQDYMMTPRDRESLLWRTLQAIESASLMQHRSLRLDRPITEETQNDSSAPSKP